MADQRPFDSEDVSPVSTVVDPGKPTTATTPAPTPAGVEVIPPVSGRRGRRGRLGHLRSRLRRRLGGYLALTKPRIVELLLVTTVPAMLLAAAGDPPIGRLIVVVVAGACAAGAANALNCYLDRDLDALMRRTAARPLPAHTISPRAALVFGLGLAAVATALMAVFTTLLATLLTVAAIVYYDLVYTWWLKRSTPLSTFWGGVCGAAPVLIGWSAVTGSLAPLAWAMFGIVFFWQMPHFYALALSCREDYARAGIPMLPVVASPRRVALESVAFAWLTVICSLLLWALGLGWWYGLAATAAGALFLVEAHRMSARVRSGSAVAPRRLFHASTTYLTAVFAAIALAALTGAA